ncbi:hypothetical protein NUSPORA_01400 [Nucleospora cyclopteri]
MNLSRSEKNLNMVRIVFRIVKKFFNIENIIGKFFDNKRDASQRCQSSHILFKFFIVSINQNDFVLIMNIKKNV